MLLDGELWRWTPDDATLFFTRTRVSQGPRTAQLIESISGSASVARATEDLVTTESIAYAYVCTSCSFVRGVQGERDLVDTMVQTGAPAALTTSGALIKALQHVGASRVVAVTPYNDELTSLFIDFLLAEGIGVARHANLGLTSGIAEVSDEAVLRLIRDSDTPDTDAICVACTNLPTYDCIETLERELGKPVVTANQATMWALLRLADHSPPRDIAQRLFRQAPAVDPSISKAASHVG